MKNKRIAHFTETGAPGGAETLMLQICERVKESGNIPIVYHNGGDYFVEQCRSLGIEEAVPVGFKEFKSIKTLPLFVYKFKQYLQAQKIDVLHSHLYGPITGAAFAAKLAGIPHVGTLHDVYTIENRPWRIHLLQLAAFLGTKLITVSDTMEAFYRKRAFFKKDHIETIVNGVDCSPISASGVREEFGIANDELIIINVGRLATLKRHDLLLDAIERINLNVPWRLLIVGDGPERDAINAKVQKLQLQDKVILAGHRDDVRKLLSSADIFVQCSDTEGLSMSIMEAMAAGLPSVVTNVGGNHELVDSANGFIVEAGNKTVLADALQKLLANAELRQTMHHNTLKKVQSRFNIDITFQQYLNHYQSLLGNL